MAKIHAGQSRWDGLRAGQGARWDGLRAGQGSRWDGRRAGQGGRCGRRGRGAGVREQRSANGRAAFTLAGLRPVVPKDEIIDTDGGPVPAVLLATAVELERLAAVHDQLERGEAPCTSGVRHHARNVSLRFRILAADKMPLASLDTS
eukprot:355497-Chlamydomonas_euryale.AAC.1